MEGSQVQCMFNLQEWECTAVRAHISLSLRDCWETAGDWWERTARFVISYINPDAILPMGVTEECGNGRCCSTAWLAVALQRAAMACQPRKNPLMNFTGVGWFLHWVHRSISTPLCCLSRSTTAMPCLCTLAYWSLTTSYIIAHLPSKSTPAVPS